MPVSPGIILMPLSGKFHVAIRKAARVAAPQVTAMTHTFIPKRLDRRATGCNLVTV